MTQTAPRTFVFVLMPFETAFNDIYKFGIKETAVEAGAYAERVDEQMYDERVLDRIYNQIAKADIIVADMTGRNANVFYETGYAHALDKRVILLTKDATDIPFDLKDRPHIVYDGSIEKLKSELFKWLSWAIKNPIENISHLAPPIQFFANGIPLVNNPCFRYQKEREQFVVFQVDAHNPIERGLLPLRFRLGVLSSGLFTHTWEDDQTGFPAARVPDGKRMHVFNKTYEILPGGWVSAIHLGFGVEPQNLQNNVVHQFILRMFSDGTPIDFPFRMLFWEEEKENANKNAEATILP